jgi:protein-L-isoaspartate O-methyltransferase
MKSALQLLVDACGRDPSLREPDRLHQRIEAIDRLEDELADRADQPDDTGLQQRARVLCEELEAINSQIYSDIRHDIQHGSHANALMKWVPSPLFNDASSHRVSGESYDELDALLGGVLQLPEPADDIAALAPEMVFYQPTPARHIFDLIDRLQLGENDVLIDLGSGLGHVPLVAAIRSRARCVGVELEAAYVACARQCAHALNLANVRFVVQDVQATDLSEGTVFYLYTPFTGTIWQSVLGRLQQEAKQRTIRICTLGPCTALMAEQSWLHALGALHADRIAVFRSA